MYCDLYLNTTVPSVIETYYNDKNLIIFNSGNAYIYNCNFTLNITPNVSVNNVCSFANRLSLKTLFFSVLFLQFNFLL